MKFCLLVRFNALNLHKPELSISDLEAILTDCPDCILCSEGAVYELLHTLYTTKSSGDDNVCSKKLL